VNLFKDRFVREALLIIVIVFAAFFIFGLSDLGRLFAFVQFESEPIPRETIGCCGAGQHDVIQTGPLGYSGRAEQGGSFGELYAVQLWDPNGRQVFSSSAGPIASGYIDVNGQRTTDTSNALFYLQTRSSGDFAQINLMNNYFSSVVNTNIITSFYFEDSINDVKVNVFVPEGIYKSGTTLVSARINFWLTTTTGVTGGDKVIFVWKDPDNVVGKAVNLEIGKNNEFTFTLPSNLVVSEYTAKAVPVIADNFAIDAIATRRFLINPSTIYKTVQPGQSCPDGYVFSTDTVCVRSDLSDLSCVQLGCPVTIDKTYSCSSSGLCVEEVFQATGCTSDSQCESGQVCDVNSGVCYNQKVITEILQCTAPSDCASPCIGINIICSLNNKCVYDGVCGVITEPELLDCNNKGCNTGFACNTDTGNCEGSSSSTAEQLVTSGGSVSSPSGTSTIQKTEFIMPDAPSVEINPRSTKKPLGAGTAAIIALVAGVVWYFLRKKRWLKW